jgi:hypothetical protein
VPDEVRAVAGAGLPRGRQEVGDAQALSPRSRGEASGADVMPRGRESRSIVRPDTGEKRRRIPAASVPRAAIAAAAARWPRPRPS